MSIFKQSKQTISVQKEIETVLVHMKTLKPESQEYTATAKNLETLCSANSKVKDQKVSWDTIITVAGSLVGIAIIIGYEHTGVIMSKALGFVVKGRV